MIQLRELAERAAALTFDAPDELEIRFAVVPRGLSIRAQHYVQRAEYRQLVSMSLLVDWDALESDPSLADTGLTLVMQKLAERSA